MKEYDVIVSVEILQTVVAFDEDEAVRKVEEHLTEDQSLLIDNLGFEVNEA